MRSRIAIGTLVTAGALVGLVTGCSPNDAGPATSSAVESVVHPPATATPSTVTQPAPTEQTTAATPAPQAETTDQQVPTVEPTTPAATTPAAVPCDSASAGAFATIAAESSVGSRLVKPVVFDRLQCAGTSAVGHTAPDGVHQPTGVLFRYSPGSAGGQWIAVEVGSAIDCGRFGAAPEDAAKLEGCL
ncbi:hypothetical protein [Gordonia phthalatica]|uniref:hypothetical protein n=1 Tax=Gordonia phthalatica TaxID=1136941 RepID=UPI000785639F|nr:hypothetical protein [Gordonia phthalatica]